MGEWRARKTLQLCAPHRLGQSLWARMDVSDKVVVLQWLVCLPCSHVIVCASWWLLKNGWDPLQIPWIPPPPRCFQRLCTSWDAQLGSKDSQWLHQTIRHTQHWRRHSNSHLLHQRGTIIHILSYTHTGQTLASGFRSSVNFRSCTAKYTYPSIPSWFQKGVQSHLLVRINDGA